MRPIPRYWASVEEVVTFPDTGAFHLTIRGSSDLTVEDAERDARERFDRLVAAGGPERGRRDHEYYPDRRLPEELLEEIRGPDGELLAAITRNRYGAAVLNTDAVLISDIDISAPTAPSRSAPSTQSGGFFSRLFGGARTRSPAPADPEDPDEYGLPAIGARGEEHQRILRMIEDFGTRHPELGVRTYRTRNGFRLLLTGSGAGPGSDRARELMGELHSDRLYMTLCRVHDSYRARLTPKPWRIGIRRPHGGGPSSAGVGQDQRWVEKYEAASREVAVCRLIETAGPGPDRMEQQIIDLHDRAVKSDSGLRLA